MGGIFSIDSPTKMSPYDPSKVFFANPGGPGVPAQRYPSVVYGSPAVTIGMFTYVTSGKNKSEARFVQYKFPAPGLQPSKVTLFDSGGSEHDIYLISVPPKAELR